MVLNCAFVCREKVTVYLCWVPTIWTVIDYFAATGTVDLLRLIENLASPNLTAVYSRMETYLSQTPSVYTSVITSRRVC